MDGAGRPSSRGRAVARIVASVLLGAWFAVTLTFLLFQTQNEAASLFEGLPEAVQEQLRAELGLDRSAPERYLSFVGDAVRGDLGIAFVNGEPVTDIVGPAVLRSLVLMASAVLIAFVAARALAVAAVRTPNGGFDRFVMAASSVLASIPFHYAFIALLILGVYNAELFPPVGFRSGPATGWGVAWDVVRHSALVALAIVVSLVGRFTLVIRARILDRLEWTGETPRSWRARRRAFLASSGGSLRAIAERMGFIISAVIVVESISGWPGAGELLTNSAFSFDYPVLQGVFLILTVFSVALVCVVRRRWPVSPAAATMSSLTRNRAVRGGVVLTVVWIAFALLAPVILPSEQRTAAWGTQHGAPISAPPFSTCDGAVPPCPAGEHHVWLLGTNGQGVSNLEIAWEDRSRLGFVGWVVAIGVALGAVIGMLAGARPRRVGSALAWLVDVVAAVPFVLVLVALIVVPHDDDASKVALAVIGAGLVARPVSEAWRAPGAGRRFRAVGAGAASLASFAFLAAALLPFSWIQEGNGIGLGWFRLGMLAVNATIPVLGLRLVALGLSARRRSLFPAVSGTQVVPATATE